MKKIFNKPTTKLSNNKGFTVLEVMAILTLLAILYSLSTTSKLNMELKQVEADGLAGTEELFFTVQDKLIQHREDGTYPELTDPESFTGGKLWRGFNPAPSFKDLSDEDKNYYGYGGNEEQGGFDVAFMVEYPEYIREQLDAAKSNSSYTAAPINYTNINGVDVREGYQLPHLKDLIPPSEGLIESYGILFELHTGTLLEISVIAIPYDNSGTLEQTTENARMAAKIAADILGDGIRNCYQNYIMPGAAPNMSGPASLLNVFETVPAGQVNGYGDTHLFVRDNMMSTISEEMLENRYIYAGSRSNVLGGIDNYLDDFNRTLKSQLTYYGLSV